MFRDTFELPVPPFYDPRHAGEWSYRPDAGALLAAAESWRELNRMRPAGLDAARTLLLLVDAQKDFCLPEGALFVGGRSGRGAVEDSDRIARFLYRNLGWITEVICTLDTHSPQQIFFPSFWRDAEGRHPAPHREVTSEALKAGELEPHPCLAGACAEGDTVWLRRYAEFYCEALEKTGKHRLYLWPFHCLLGSAGHDLVGVIEEARLFHSFCRTAEDPIETKGTAPLTESYSALSTEVLTSQDGRTVGVRNDALIDRLLGADRLIVAGQAASHCVKSTLDDLLAEIERRGEPALAQKVVVLADCMSAVTVPDPTRPGELAFDFTPQAEAALARCRAAGMRVVSAQTPAIEWDR
jgi:nicotinamidase-related amidase